MARRTQAISFPHPVVGVGDDVQGTLRCEAPEFDFGVDHTTLSVNGLAMTNPTIAGLIRQGVAAFTARINCGATYYRETIQTHEAGLQHVIPSAKLLGEVKVQVRVCTLKRLDNYRPEGLHPDYEERAFSVQAGDVLALGDDFTVQVDKQFDPLAADIPSIMRIIGGRFPKGPFKVNFDAGQILITLSGEDHARYGLIANIAPGVIHAGIVLPVLSEAIARVRNRSEQDDMIAELRWFRRLEEMLEERGIGDDEGLVEAAQKLLDAPLTRAFDDTLKGREDD